MYRTGKGRWPFGVGMVRTDWAFQWTRAGRLLSAVDVHAIAADPGLAKCLERYLRKLVGWTREYTEAGGNGFSTSFPYEWGAALATTLGRYAAAAGAPDVWRALTGFQGRDHGQRMVGGYLQAVTRELIESGRAPDDRFWNAWRGAADRLLDELRRRRRLADDHVEEWAAAAGLMGPYATPLPEGWPHLDAVLPEVDRWAQLACGSAPAAWRIVKFASRLDTTQRGRWLLPWVGQMVERRKGDREFWGYADMGDKLAELLEPLAATGNDTRGEVRRLISVIADGGSHVAREALARLARQGNRG